MANQRQVVLLKRSVLGWNEFVRRERAISATRRADLIGADLRGAHLTGADLRGAHLTRADLGRVDLTRANLRGADLRGADLTGADLTGADLTGADLRGADLTRADLSRANLIGANLTAADLTDADLTRANLSDSNLNRADLIRADITGAYLKGANLGLAKLRDVDFRSARFNAEDLEGADLTGSIFCGADFRDADLSGAVLYDADLRDAVFRNAILRRARLSGAVLKGADLRGADLEGSDMSGADLTGAQLSGVDLRSTSFARATLTEARLDASTFKEETETSTSFTSFLDLASCHGIEKACFDSGFDLDDYLSRAFSYAHRDDTREARYWLDFVDETLERIKTLRILQSADEESPLLVQAIDTLSFELIDYLKKHPKQLYGIPPHIFEKIVAEVLAGYGWKVDLTPKAGDGGYDIFALSPDKAGVDTSWIIECKRYAPDRPIGVDIVRALYGANDLNRGPEAAGMKMLATTSHFTAGAKAFKASRYDLALKDYESILDWLNTYRPNPNGKLYLDSSGRLVVPGYDD